MKSNKPDWYGKACEKLCAERDFTLNKCQAIGMERAGEIWQELQALKAEVLEVAKILYRSDRGPYHDDAENLRLHNGDAIQRAIEKLSKIGGEK